MDTAENRSLSGEDDSRSPERSHRKRFGLRAVARKFMNGGFQATNSKLDSCIGTAGAGSSAGSLCINGASSSRTTLARRFRFGFGVSANAAAFLAASSLGGATPRRRNVGRTLESVTPFVTRTAWGLAEAVAGFNFSPFGNLTDSQATVEDHGSVGRRSVSNLLELPERTDRPTDE